MKGPHDETADLLDTLLYTVKVIATSGPDDKQRIANAYQDARRLAATIGLVDADIDILGEALDQPIRLAGGHLKVCSLNRV